MASLREIARDNFDYFQQAIQWIAVWKEGRRWNAELFYGTEYEEGNRRFGRETKWIISEDDQKRLREIAEIDSNACLLNAYYDNLGPLEDMTIESLMDGIRFQYRIGGDLEYILNQATKPNEGRDAK